MLTPAQPLRFHRLRQIGMRPTSAPAWESVLGQDERPIVRMLKQSRYLYTSAAYISSSAICFRLPSDAGRSESPYVGSDNGAASDDASPSPAKGKGKSKTKRVGKPACF